MPYKLPGLLNVYISKGELDGQQAFMNGDYRVSGDMGLLLKFNTMFESAPGEAEEQGSNGDTNDKGQMTNDEEQKETQPMDMSNLNCKETIAGMPTVFNPG